MLEPWDIIWNCDQTLKGFGGWRPFQGSILFNVLIPRVLAMLEPWAEISHAFGVIFV